MSGTGRASRSIRRAARCIADPAGYNQTDISRITFNSMVIIPIFGIVRLTGHELADQMQSRLSRGELTPLGQGSGSVFLEDFTAGKVAVLVEVIVDRGVGGGEFLQGLYVSELRHRTFSSPERLVGILGSIIAPPTTLLIGCIANYVHRRSIRPKPIGHN